MAQATWFPPLRAPGELPALTVPHLPCFSPGKVPVLQSSVASVAVEVLPESALEHLAWSGIKGALPWCPKGKGAGGGLAPSVTSPLPSPLADGHSAETEAAALGPPPSCPAAGGAPRVTAPWETKACVRVPLHHPCHGEREVWCARKGLQRRGQGAWPLAQCWFEELWSLGSA